MVLYCLLYLFELFGIAFKILFLYPTSSFSTISQHVTPDVQSVLLYLMLFSLPQINKNSLHLDSTNGDIVCSMCQNCARDFHAFSWIYTGTLLWVLGAKEVSSSESSPGSLSYWIGAGISSFNNTKHPSLLTLPLPFPTEFSPCFFSGDFTDVTYLCKEPDGNLPVQLCILFYFLTHTASLI